MDQPVGRIVKCPRCGIATAFSSTNPSRPFCSERCRLLDLGAWASEKFAIPGKEIDPADVNQNPDAGSDDAQE